MPIETIVASTPTTIPTKTYDKWWVSHIAINAHNVNGDANAMVTLTKFRYLEDGTKEASDERVNFMVEGLLEKAQTDAALASVVEGLMSYVVTAATEQGKI
jgi:uncharacterized protein (DUF885 family)